MNEDAIRRYLAKMPEAELDYPFDEYTAAYKIKGKIFALLYRQNQCLKVNLKCNPDEAVQLRDVFDGIHPGYHMNKKHWNTIDLNGSVPDCEIERMIDNSYALVVSTLRKLDKQGLALRSSGGGV